MTWKWFLSCLYRLASLEGYQLVWYCPFYSCFWWYVKFSLVSLLSRPIQKAYIISCYLTLYCCSRRVSTATVLPESQQTPTQTASDYIEISLLFQQQQEWWCELWLLLIGELANSGELADFHGELFFLRDRQVAHVGGQTGCPSH